MKKAFLLTLCLLITYTTSYAQKSIGGSSGSATGVETVAYITKAGHAYYDLGSAVGVGPQAHTLSINWDNSQMTYDSGLAVSIFNKIGKSVKFLNGTLHFYVFDHNPDPGHPSQTVNRLAVLGVKRNGSLGFIREFDYLGGRIPSAASFETLLNGVNNSFVVLEAGSPASLK
ncbi:MAG: hypothetical protein ACPGVB_02640 [Chitinophagales bacterium]